MVSAVLVIDAYLDMQKENQNGPEVQAAIKRINQVTATARKAGKAIIFIRTQSQVEVEVEGKYDEVSLPASPFDVRSSDYQVNKTMPDAFYGTRLEYLLEKLFVAKLFICGMKTECCVDATVRSALIRKYKVVLVSDCHTTNDKEYLSAAQIVRHHNETLSSIRTYRTKLSAMRAEEICF